MPVSAPPSLAGVVRELDPAVMRALSSPSAYQGRPQVSVVQTHASVVFLAGERAYKLKKPVVFDFLDYSTPARRRAACIEEVRVNAVLAPKVYLGMRSVVPSAGAFQLADPDAPDAVDYAVEMARFEPSQTLLGAIATGRLGHAQVRGVAHVLARFHSEAQRVRGGGPEKLLCAWLANLEELGRLEGAAGWRLSDFRRFGEAFVRARGAEIARRAQSGCVRDGHGDLRCEHVLLEPEIQIVDRIEFDPSLRAGDVAADLAFLTMDLELHRQGWAARELIGAYRHAGGRPGGEELRSFYAAHRALVRAKVTLLSAEQDGSPLTARRLLRLAERLCWRARRPLAIVVCGPPASGKSTLAAELARHARLPVLSSDIVRKRLAGITPTSRASAEHYTSQFTHATYDLLSREALASVRLRGGAIVDATCRTRGQRALLTHRLAPAGALLFVHCDVPAEVAAWRARRRIESERMRISDATPEIVLRQHRDFQAPAELPARQLLKLDAQLPVERQVTAVAAAVDRLLIGQVSALPRRSGVFTRSPQPQPRLP